MRRKSGFSLLELVLAMGLSLLVLGLGILQTRPGGGGTDTKALAVQVAAELRAARVRAVTQRRPVAVVIPSQDGTYPLARSLYILDGGERAKIVRYLDLSDRKCFLFVGSWPGPATALMPPTKSMFQVEGWPRTPTRDYIFMFTPEGRLLTNDLPAYDGQYHILVGSRVDFAPGPAPTGSPTVTNPPSYFNLTGVNDPVVLTLTSLGSISLKVGLPGADPMPAAVGPQVLGSEVVTPASMPNTPPEINGVTVYPAPVEATAEGYDAVLAPDAQLTLKVKASDPEGDPLTCKWTSTPITSDKPGTFSIPDRTEMRYDGRPATWVWMPPSNVNTGDEFTLTCSVQDDLGAEILLDVDAAINVKVRDTGSIVYQKPDSNGKARLWRCCGDGTATESIYTGLNSNVRNARFSANGSKLIFQADPAGNSDLYYTNRDGSGRVALRTYQTDEVDPSWHPNGTQVLWSEPPVANPSPTPYAVPPVPVLRKMQADRGNPMSLKKGGGWAAGAIDPAVHMAGAQPAWSKDGNRIAFISTESGKPDLWVCKADGTGLVNLTNDDFDDQRPRWAPDNDMLMWLSDRSGVLQVHTLKVSDPAVVEQRTDTPEAKVDACFSPKFNPTSGQIIFVADDGTNVKLWRADMRPTGPCLELVDLGLPGLSRALGVHPDWGK